MGQVALVVGSAACQTEDLARALPMGEFDLVIAVNRAARDWEGRLEHWVTMHAELLPKWIQERRDLHLPDAGDLWTGAHRPLSPHLPKMRRTANWGGSSGLLAVSCGFTLGVDRMVLVGIPLDHEQGHVYSPDKKWRDAVNYRRGWKQHLEEMAGRVRSMSGWTAELLGQPTPEWLAGEA